MCLRCGWATSEQDIIYHDTEWGKPNFNDQYLFEMLFLESMQAGLSWSTILSKRDNFRIAFDNFNIQKIAQYDATKIAELLANPGIIRNRLKINAAISNAQLFIAIQKEYGNFADFLWQYIDHKPIINNWSTLVEVPAYTPLAEKISNDFKKRGFKFVGPTIIYAYMQAIGMVNDHLVSCCMRYE